MRKSGENSEAGIYTYIYFEDVFSSCVRHFPLENNFRFVAEVPLSSTF